MKMVRILAAVVVMAAAARARGQEAAPARGTGALKSGTVKIYDAPGTSGPGTVTLQSQQPAVYAGVMTVNGVISGETVRPALVSTAAMDGKVRGEWEEDLAVMDKLVGSAIRATGETGAPQAMGIAVRAAPGQGPLYVEGCGVVVMGSVSWPLAGSVKAGAGERPAAAASAWDAAKRQLYGGSGEQTVVGRLTARRELERRSAQADSGAAFTLRSDQLSYQLAEVPAPFSEERVANLRRGLVGALLEAKNFRHLKGEEFVMVTVSGENDMGQAVRWTIKAQKADIDAAGAGKMTLEQFAGKVKETVQ